MGSWTKVSGVPDRGALVESLARLRDEDDRSAAGELIGPECRVALYALVKANDALAARDGLGASMYLRVIAETAIRLRWLLGDDEDESGRPLGFTAASVAARGRQLQMRDLRLLRKAFRAIKDVLEQPPELLPGLDKRIAELGDGPAAPENISELATSKHARKVYAAHRLSSMTIHPGAVLGRRALDPLGVLGAMVDEAAAVCAGAAEMARRAP
jgi:hypothetical protein